MYCEYIPVSVEEVVKAEITIIKLVQSEAFQPEIHLLSNESNKVSKHVIRSSPLHKLDPFIDDGLIRVGDSSAANVKLPIILPKDSHVTELIIHHYRQWVHHQGRNIMLNEIRS